MRYFKVNINKTPEEHEKDKVAKQILEESGKTNRLEWCITDLRILLGDPMNYN